jgi:predicted nucleotidyltransferase
MKPSIAIKGKEAAISSVVAKYGYSNPKIFGSTVSGKDVEGSDLDILVTRSGSKGGMLNLVHLELELSELLGVHVDVKTEKMIPQHSRKEVVEGSLSL